MRTARFVLLAIQPLVLLGFALALRNGSMPLGVRGEWEWLRLPETVTLTWLEAVTGLGGIVLYSVIVGFGYRFLATRPTRRREGVALAVLGVSAIVVQVLIQNGAPEGYGLSKWAIALSSPGSNGYYSVAKNEIHDRGRFLEEYPEWIKRQDALHIGTHPPGLLLVQHVLLETMEAHPVIARFILEHIPFSVDLSLKVIGPLSRADRATLVLTGAFTLLACATTVVPLYLLARAHASAPVAWAVASAWPLVPSAILFQPDADTAFPLLSTSALALASFARQGQKPRALLLTLCAGVVLAGGMMLTLAFLPVGLIVGILLVSARQQPFRQRIAHFIATGVGFFGATLLGWWYSRANPFVIWWWNQHNHARFYVEYPRSYLAWLVANPIELGVALGLPVVVWSLIAFWRPRQIPLVSYATLGVLAFLTLSGKNLSEVARLWLPLMPPLLLMMGQGLSSLRAGAKTLVATVILMGLETLLLEMTIQVVYPI